MKPWSIRKTNDRAVNREQACNGLPPRFGFRAVQKYEPLGFEFPRTSGYCCGVFKFKFETDLRNGVLLRPHRCAEACLSCLVERPDPEMLAALEFLGCVVLAVLALKWKAERIDI